VADKSDVNVCTDEHLSTDAGGLLQLKKWSVPRLVADLRAESAGDGSLASTIALPGKLLIQAEVGWTNDSPVDHMMLIRVIRSWRGWLTSNPNAIQFRDRWTWAIDRTPSIPVTTGIFNSQVGSAIDVGTNSVSEPNPGRQWVWTPVTMSDEWVGPLAPGQRLEVHYRTYVWTPPPFSDNANKNSPQHVAQARYSRVQLQAFPTQGSLVVG
jgi:hypothetical protein